MKKTLKQKRESKRFRTISTIGIITSCFIPILWIIVLICYFSSTKKPRTIIRDYTYTIGIITIIIGIPTSIIFIAYLVLYIGF